MKFFNQIISSVNISSALNYFDELKEDANLSDILPKDVLEVICRIGWNEFIEEYPSGKEWDGPYFMNLFQDRWSEGAADLQIKNTNFQPEMRYLGLILKKFYIWEYISLFLFYKSSLPFEILLETENDLRCSIYLAKEVEYFKQAFQVLRNFLELNVSILYFYFDKKSYQIWINSKENKNFPDIRFMINFLKSPEVQFLNEQESKFLHEHYSKLNNSVHSKRHQLNMNKKRLERYVNTFGKSDLRNWLTEFDNIVSFMIKIYLEKIFTRK
ncbi:hypothetical protein ACFLRW_04500 [Acidobacteriota bacterium]